MFAGGYREMNGQNRIRIHQHLEIRAQRIGNLLGGAISFAKKTRPLTQGITIYFCPVDTMRAGLYCTNISSANDLTSTLRKSL